MASVKLLMLMNDLPVLIIYTLPATGEAPANSAKLLRLQKLAMKPIKFLFLLSMSVLSCQEKESNSVDVATSQSDYDTLPRAGDSMADTTATATAGGAQQKILVLSTNALQIVDRQTGSSTELSFGMPQEQLINIVSRVLEMPVASVGNNSECGAGPLKMASWGNGLTLVFQEKEGADATSGGAWQFVGNRPVKYILFSSYSAGSFAGRGPGYFCG
jgi:hypothetical protein